MPAIRTRTLTVDMRDVMQKMQSLRKGKVQSIVRRALMQGAIVLRNAARAKAPRRTGALARSIVARTDRRGKDRDDIRAYIAIERKAFNLTPKGKAKVVNRPGGARPYERGDIYPRNYAHLVEFGVKPHTIKPKRKGGAVMTPAGPRPEIQHPGFSPKPFMRPAYDEKSGDAIAAVRATALRLIEKEVGKGKP